MQEDPLAGFGAVDRELPDKDLAATIALQDVLIHYNKPHWYLKWEHLGQLIKEVVNFDTKTVPCLHGHNVHACLPPAW
jgi:hypothetical protein